MKVLIVYDSVSPMKLTAKIAETIGTTLKEMKLESILSTLKASLR